MNICDNTLWSESTNTQHEHLFIQTPIEQCAWCWQNLHPGVPYPEAWSSTICHAHADYILLQQRQRRKKQQ